MPPHKDVPDQNVADEVNPEDSASNVSSLKANSIKSHSQLSRIFSTSSAHTEAQADKEALVEHVAALKMKHLIESYEEKGTIKA